MLKTVLNFTYFDIEPFYDWSEKQSVDISRRLINTPFPYRNKMPFKNPDKNRFKNDGKDRKP